jgi:hypothetical protein
MRRDPSSLARRHSRVARSIRVVTLGGTFIASEKGWYGSPAVTVNFNDDRFIILCLQAHEKGRFEVLDRIRESWPDLVVGLEVEAKVGAKPAGDGSMEIHVRGDARCSTVQKRTEMLEGWTGGCGENLAAMKTPSQSISHVHQWGETTLVDDSSWVDAIDEGGKGCCGDRSITTGGNNEGGWVIGNRLKPGLKSRLNGFHGLKERACRDDPEF